MTRLPDELADAIVEDDDREARLVAADFLQQKQDPHGELIALSLSGDPSHAARIAELERELAPVELGWTTRWRDGFVTRLAAVKDAEVDALGRLLGEPVVRFVRGIELANFGRRVAAAVAPLANPPPSLRSLVIRDDAIVRHAIANLRSVAWSKLVRLEHLALHMHHVAPPLELPALEELLVYIDGVNVHELSLARLPALRTLRAIAMTPDLSSLTADRFPSLRHLSIAAPSIALDAISGRMPPLAAQLETYETLALAVGGERDTRRFIIPGPLSNEHAVLLDLSTGVIEPVPSSRVFRVGRTPDAQLRMSNVAPGASFELDWAGQGWWLRNNRAGALLHNCAVESVELRDGDELRANTHAYRFFTGEPDAVAASVDLWRRRLGL